MTIKEYITVPEQVAFVEMVCDTASGDGLVHQPALFEFAFRVAALAYFTDTGFEMVDGLIDMEAANAVVFGTGCYEQVLNGKSGWQLRCLREACKEEIKNREARQQILLAAHSHPDPLVRLVEVLEGWLEKNGSLQDFDFAGMMGAIDKLDGLKAALGMGGGD